MPDDEVKAEPTEEETPEAEPTEELPESVEELASLIDRRAETEYEEAMVEDAPPVAEEEEEPTAEDQEAAAGDLEEQATQPEETTPEPKPLDEIEKQLEEANQQVDKFKRLAGREAGRSGYLEQEVKKLTALVENLTKQRRQPTEEMDYGTAPAEAGEFGSLAQTVESLQEKLKAHDRFLTQQAIQEAGLQFLQRFPDASNDYGQEIAERIAKDLKPDFEAMTDAADPVTAKQRTSELIESVYWQVKREKLSAELEERKRASADQAASLRQKKLAAAPAQSGGGKAAPRPKPKTLDTIEDLRKEIDRRAARAV